MSSGAHRNNHVLAAVNAGSAGDLILRPGPFDGGVFPADAVATLERFEPITFGMTGYNVVDCAVAKPLYSRNVVNAIIGRRCLVALTKPWSDSRFSRSAGRRRSRSAAC
jgi:hypothetical protein